MNYVHVVRLDSCCFISSTICCTNFCSVCGNFRDSASVTTFHIISFLCQALLELCPVLDLFGPLATCSKQDAEAAFYNQNEQE